jgi:hypothetical protein
MFFTNRLVRRNDGSLVPPGRHVAERFIEATLTELIGAAKKLNRIVHVERSQQELHGSIMLVAQRQDVSPHGPILASQAKQNRQTSLPVGLLVWNRS